MKRLLTIFLAIIFILIAPSCSCRGKETPEEDQSLVFSKYYLVKDRKSDYTIVFPENGTYYEEFAVYELQTFFYEATGVMLPAVVDSSYTVTDDKSFISVGNTSLLKDSDITISYDEVKETGYKIVNKEANLYLAGGDYAVHSAVYAFLSYQFKYDAIAYDEIYIEKTKGDVRMYEYNLLEKPDLMMVSDYGEILNSRDVSLRMQLMRLYDVFLPVESKGGGYWHNFLGIFSPSKYNDKENHPETYHPEWFSNGQLNLSIAVDEMTDVLVEHWKQLIKDSEEIGLGTEIAWTFTPMDNWDWSTADSSMALYEQYNSYAAEYIKFVNEAARKFNPWLEQNYPDRHIRYCIFAYHLTIDPPNKMDVDGNCIKDENGKYMVADETVILEDNVTLWYAPINGSFYYSFEEDDNKKWDDILEKWMPICDDNPIWYWLYCCNFEGLLVPLDVTHSLQTNMKWAKEHNGEMFMIESDAYNNTAPNWSKLHLYLQKELGKDIDADVSKLVDKFFDKYYKNACEPMRKYYDEFTAHFAYLAETTNLTFNYMTEPKIAERSNWPYALLEQWLNYIDEAYESIAVYQENDPALYIKLKNRITLESLTIRYLMVRNYSARLTNKNEYILQLMSDSSELGVTNWTGRTSLSDHLKNYMN